MIKFHDVNIVQTQDGHLLTIDAEIMRKIFSALIYFETLAPVELNDQFFADHGFTKQGSSFSEYYHLTPLVIYKEHDGYYFRQSNDYINRFPIIYVHQLQNLYYDLRCLEFKFRMPDQQIVGIK